MDECLICSEDIESQYAIINSEGETAKYCPKCLELWFTTHKSGILTQTSVESYSIFKDTELIQTIKVDLHYSNFTVFYNEIRDDFNVMFSGNYEEPIELEESSTEASISDVFFLCIFC